MSHRLASQQDQHWWSAPRRTEDDKCKEDGELQEETAQLCALINECTHMAGQLAHNPSYGVAWQAITLHVIPARFNDLRGVQWVHHESKMLLNRLRDSDHDAGRYCVNLSFFSVKSNKR